MTDDASRRSPYRSSTEQHSPTLAVATNLNYAVWTSPNGVDHAIVRGRCVTCGKPHGSSPA